MTCVFDENLPPRLARAFNELEGKHGIEVIHMREHFGPGTTDMEWIEELSKIDNCFIITHDRKIKKNPHEYKAWKESQLPIVFMQKSWKDQQFWDLSWKILKRWEEIKAKAEKRKSILLPVSGKIEEL